MMNLETVEGYREKTDEVALRLAHWAVELRKADTDAKATVILANIQELVREHSSFIAQAQKQKAYRKQGIATNKNYWA